MPLSGAAFNGVSVRFTGTALSGDIVRIKNASGIILYSALTDGSGQWGGIVPGIVSGVNNLTYYATDAS